MILVSILLIILSGAAIGYYLFNKGPIDVKSSSGIKINASELYADFTTDSTAAQKKYAGKIVEVSGIVHAVSVKTEASQLVTIATNTEGAFINCTMEGPVAGISSGDKVSIKGICSGIGQGEPDLGIKGDVYLSRCFIN